MAEISINDNTRFTIGSYQENFKSNNQVLNIDLTIDSKDYMTLKNSLTPYIQENSIDNIKIYDKNDVLIYETTDYHQLTIMNFSGQYRGETERFVVHLAFQNLTQR